MDSTFFCMREHQNPQWRFDLYFCLISDDKWPLHPACPKTRQLHRRRHVTGVTFLGARVTSDSAL